MPDPCNQQLALHVACCLFWQASRLNSRILEFGIILLQVLSVTARSNLNQAFFQRQGLLQHMGLADQRGGIRLNLIAACFPFRKIPMSNTPSYANVV